MYVEFVFLCAILNIVNFDGNSLKNFLNFEI